ncbi:hypothetical protein HNQ56_001257 [Anaerotaenia torta]|uniref:DUF1848 domain-containing protein n=1 Tax=Anaerotaenia torta TaxID=433293 RepID=UPI003D1F157F
MILSASRRTDLPCYYSQWLMNRLEEGYALYRNPMNHAQICKVDLSPENIDCIVFWTKDPLPLMDKLERLEEMGYSYYFQFTLTPYGKEIEPHLRDKPEIVSTFQQLSRRLGRHRVLWRYDPVIINDRIPLEYHYREFANLCERLSGYTQLCTISFVDQYSKLARLVRERVIKTISEEQMRRLAAEFAGIAGRHQIELRACCEAVDLSPEGICPASCIDQNTIEGILGHPLKVKRDKSQRSGCGCIQSVDIGAYNTCRNGCIYCYANHSEDSILRNCARHDPASPMLIGNESVKN